MSAVRAEPVVKEEPKEAVAEAEKNLYVRDVRTGRFCYASSPFACKDEPAIKGNKARRQQGRGRER
jgi:hypothetical protein